MKGLKGFLTRGLEACGFERVAGHLKDTPADFVETILKDYEASDGGKQAQRDADEALARVESRASNQRVEAELQKARTNLTRSGDLEQGRLDSVVRDNVLGAVTGVGAEQQAINKEALGDVHGRAIRPGIHGLRVHEGSVAFQAQESVKEEIRDLQTRIAEAEIRHAWTAATTADAPEQKWLETLAKDNVPGPATAVNAERQRTNEETFGTLCGRAINAGVKDIGTNQASATGRFQQSVSEEIKELLRKIADATARTTANSGTKPSLTAPPPQPAGRQ